MANLPPFDAALEFKSALNMRVAGHAVIKDQPIDKAWFGDDETARDRTLKLLYENHRIVPMTEQEAEAVVPALTDEQTARVADLVGSNDRASLNKLAAGDPYKIADADKLPSKDAVATAIVRAEAAAA